MRFGVHFFFGLFTTLQEKVRVENRNFTNFASRKFEEHATGVLQECYEENEALSRVLLVKELETFGNLTALDLAVMAEDQNFIAHTSCQELLTRLWMGTMAMNTRWWKVGHAP